MVELIGNLALLALPAAFAVRVWPRLGQRRVLMAVALAAGTSIETLQWVLAIGRVVSPVDALLNATGAVLAASWVARSQEGRPPRQRHAVVARLQGRGSRTVGGAPRGGEPPSSCGKPEASEGTTMGSPRRTTLRRVNSHPHRAPTPPRFVHTVRIPTRTALAGAGTGDLR
jgi:hypothetical protein